MIESMLGSVPLTVEIGASPPLALELAAGTVAIDPPDFLSCLNCGGRIPSGGFVTSTGARLMHFVWCPWCERRVGLHETAWNAFVRGPRGTAL